MGQKQKDFLLDKWINIFKEYYLHNSEAIPAYLGEAIRQAAHFIAVYLLLKMSQSEMEISCCRRWRVLAINKRGNDFEGPWVYFHKQVSIHYTPCLYTQGKQAYHFRNGQ